MPSTKLGIVAKRAAKGEVVEAAKSVEEEKA